MTESMHEDRERAEQEREWREADAMRAEYEKWLDGQDAQPPGCDKES